MAHLLIVDDDAGTLASLARAFRLAGHEATVCDNAARALELLKSQPFDMLLSDVVMPGAIDGRELAVHARQRRGVPRVVLMSGYAPDLGQPTDVPMLAKPFTKRQLAALLEEDSA